VTVAKALSSSYLPIAGAMISEKIYQAIRDESGRQGVFGTGYTYSGHPVCAAVALETLKIYEETDIIGHVRSISPHFLRRLHALGDHPLVGETRGVGLIGGIQLVKNKATKEMYEPSLKVAPTVMSLAVEHGLLIRSLPNDSIGVCPPLIITLPQIDDMFDSLGRALDDMLDALTKQGEAAE
jgi:4-aminobutyrate--pyruvate transaminase